MEILPAKKPQELLNYLSHVKTSLKEWLFVDIRLTEDSDKDFSITNIADMVHASFKDKEGKLYICNGREILMLIRWGQGAAPSDIANDIAEHLPDGSCEVHVHAPTSDGIAKLEMLITYKKTVMLVDIRRARAEKIVIIADDDMYMRMLVKKGIVGFTVHEIVAGDEVFAAYKKYVPDILFLDIHMPNMNGTKVLHDILLMDPNAYIIMLSADSSRENVDLTMRRGAKGFLTKPFTREKLQEYLQKCPTV